MRYRAIAAAAVCLALAACGSDDVTESEQSVASDETSAETVSALSCLPTDPSGWTQADDSLTDDWVALASNDDAIVATTRFGSRFRFWSSADGLTWKAATSTPNVLLGQSEHAVAGGPRGFVAVAATGQGELPNTPVVVFSDDGTSWEQIDPVSLPEHNVAWLNDAFAGPEGFLITGTTTGEFRRFVWASHDGRTWTETNLPGASEGLVAVTSTKSGWMALTLDTALLEEGEARSWYEFQQWIDETARVRVWTSEDGNGWAEVETERPPPGQPLLSMWTAPLAVHDDTLMLALNGATQGDVGARSPTVWVSTDDGRTWSEHTVWDDPDQAGFELHDTAVTDSGFLMAGYQDKPGAPGVEFVHHSSDGMNWRQCWTDPLEFLAIEPFGDALVAVTGTGTVQVWTAAPD